MTSATFSLLLDCVMASLLVVTIGYCWLLNRRIRVLQDSRSELAELIKHFDDSTRRASESVVSLQTASKKIGEHIQSKLDKAHYMSDDLAFLIEKGERLCDRIEAQFSESRKYPKVPVAATASEWSAGADSSVKSGKMGAALEAMLERVSARVKQDASAESIGGVSVKPGPRRHSRTEQELLEMLKSGKP